jgi:hypothetical protein
MTVTGVFLTASLVAISQTSWAKKIEIKDNKDIQETELQNDVPARREPAMKFFRHPSSDSGGGSFSRAHFLALHIGGYVDSAAYKWGPDEAKDVGKLTAGVTYRMGEWTNTMDLLLRVDFNSFDLAGSKPLKMSILPMIVFPEAESKFPLYFGIGAGPGIFFKQLSQESNLSLDYQLIAGVRLFDLIENVGFSIETGLKNHLHLLSDGQHNGVFVAGGVVFSF